MKNVLTRRNFIVGITSLFVNASVFSVQPFRLLLTAPPEEDIVIRNGWILKKTDL